MEYPVLYIIGIILVVGWFVSGLKKLVYEQANKAIREALVPKLSYDAVADFVSFEYVVETTMRKVLDEYEEKWAQQAGQLMRSE